MKTSTISKLRLNLDRNEVSNECVYVEAMSLINSDNLYDVTRVFPSDVFDRLGSPLSAKRGDSFVTVKNFGSPKSKSSLPSIFATTSPMLVRKEAKEIAKKTWWSTISEANYCEEYEIYKDHDKIKK